LEENNLVIMANEEFMRMGNISDEAFISNMQGLYLFRLAKTEPILSFRNGDFKSGLDDFNNPRFYKPTKEIEGTSLLTLFGMISRGQITGNIYISPPLTENGTLESGLRLIRDPSSSNHYMATCPNKISIGELKVQLENYGRSFKSINVSIPKSLKANHKEDSNQKFNRWLKMLNLLKTSNVLSEEYPMIYEEIEKYFYIFLKASNGNQETENIISIAESL
jgi:hypothetical protein